MDKKMREKFDRLRTFTQTLNNTVEKILPQMQATLDGKGETPSNCPAKEVAADRELREIRRRLKEVVAAVDAIGDALNERPDLN